MRRHPSLVAQSGAHDRLPRDAPLHPGPTPARRARASPSFAGALTDLAALLGGDGNTNIGKQPLAVISGVGAVTVEQSRPVALCAVEQLGGVKLVARSPVECAPASRRQCRLRRRLSRSQYCPPSPTPYRKLAYRRPGQTHKPLDRLGPAAVSRPVTTRDNPCSIVHAVPLSQCIKNPPRHLLDALLHAAPES